MACGRSGSDRVEWISYANDSSAGDFAEAVTNQTSPNNVAAIYVEYLTSVTSAEQGEKAKEILSEILLQYDESDKNSFISEVDRLASSLPVDSLARIVTLTSSPASLGRWLRHEKSSYQPLIQAIANSYSSDSAAIFNRSLSSEE